MISYELPVQPTTFVGRTHELAEITDLLNTPDCRLITLVGPGGIGKTRLALEIASQNLNPQKDEMLEQQPQAFPNGVYFVPLQPVNSPDLIVSAVAEAFDLQFYSGDEPQQQLFDYLCPKTLLLILDNFEHLLGGVDLIAEMLANAPNIKMLVTSRETLSLQEEWVYPVKGMRFPEAEDIADPESYTAVQFFIQNARRARPDFSLSTEQRSVLRICKLVEGMPLALEMTAAWLRRLPADEIAQQIERGLDILESPARNVPPRHRSIRVVFEHSWDLLTEPERQAFAKISIFRGGFRRDAAEAVAGATLALLSALVDKSLLHIDASGRYDMHELLRQYAEEKLSDLPDVSRQAHTDHCTFYMDFLAQRELEMLKHMAREVVADITTELKNIRAAVDWAIEQEYIERFYEAVTCLTYFYHFRCLFEEGEEVCGRIAAKMSGKALHKILGRALVMQGWFMQLRSQDASRSKMLFEEAYHVAQQVGAEDFMEDSLLRLSDAAILMGNYEEARQLARKSAERRSFWTSDWSITFELSQDGYATFLLGEYQEAKELLKEAVQSALNHDIPTGIADGRNYLGLVELALQNYHDAKQTFSENLAYAKQVTYLKGIVLSLMGAGEAACKLGDYGESRQYLSEALKTAMASHQIPYALQALTATAELLMQTGDLEGAVEVLATVLDHQAVAPDIRRRAGQLYSQLEAQVSQEMLSSAAECTKSTPLDKVIQELLDGALSTQPVQRVLARANDAPVALTERELEILGLLAGGLSNREIAEQLFLATGTVKWYLGEIYSKLYVASRTQAIARARALNLLN
jgi:predicted ATPase/DNA-binding NarL/FixJ family response regulator